MEAARYLTLHSSTHRQESTRSSTLLYPSASPSSVPAVFAESTVNPSLAEQVAQGTGVKLVPLHTGSLSKPGGGAETYIQLMRYDVSAIVKALQ
jgi:manganese/iron transport system substrate-binding protein